MIYENPVGHGATARWPYGHEHSMEIWAYGIGSVQASQAEDQIETIVEQARVAEAGSTNRMAFLQDVSVLCLVGLRQLAKEIDRLDRRIDVVSNGQASSQRAEAPAVELVELATQLGDLTSQVTTMTKAVKKLSKDVRKLSKDVKRLSKKK